MKLIPADLIHDQVTLRIFALFFTILTSSVVKNCNGNPALKSSSFQVFRIVPESNEQLDILKHLSDNADHYDIDFWKFPSHVGRFADIMIPRAVVENITLLLKENNMDYNITITDVAKLMKEIEGKKLAEHKNSSFNQQSLGSFFRRLNDEVPKNKAKYNFEDYGSYAEMTQWMRRIQGHYPSFTKVFEIGRTIEGRAIEGIKIGNPIGNTNKRVVWIDGGIHSREWAAIHTALFFINELVSKYGSDPEITYYVDSLNFYIVPCMNPDGYVYSFSATDIETRKRFWRKNRSKPVCIPIFPDDPNSVQKCCEGVDLNRNFGFHWSETGSDSNPCTSNYQGTAPFSEPETRALRDMLLSPELNGKTDAYITMHTYSQMWMYPWGHEYQTYPVDLAELKAVAKDAVTALSSLYGTRYRTGTGADLLYTASGASVDWAKKFGNIKYSYVLELRPAQAWNGFILNKDELIPTGKETWAGVKVVIEAVLKKNGLQRRTVE